MLQFARDVLRQSDVANGSDFKRRVAICAGCAEAKRCSPWAGLLLLLLQFARDVLRQSGSPGLYQEQRYVAIRAGCAEAKSEFEREETIGVP